MVKLISFSAVAESGDDFTKFSTISQWFQTLIHPLIQQRPFFKYPLVLLAPESIPPCPGSRTIFIPDKGLISPVTGVNTDTKGE
ncbi:MAG: hypothetical protein HRU34_07575 [Richelia sp.]|nr:hypothetical protein [Richelia sp.]